MSEINPNRLYRRPRTVLNDSKGSTLRAVAAHDDNREWNELLVEWGALNGLKISGRNFGPKMLAGMKTSDACDLWPGRDHDTCFARDRRAAAIVTEPYDGDGDGIAPHFDLAKYIEPLGLVVHVPPNPYASFWYPGYTRFVVITRVDFGEVRWLPEQIEYDRFPGMVHGKV